MPGLADPADRQRRPADRADSARPAARGPARDRGRALVAVATVLAVLGSVSACSRETAEPSDVPPATVVPSSSADQQTQRQAAEKTLASLSTGAKEGSARQMAATLARVDPEFEARAETLTQNLGQLDRVRWQVTNRRAELPAARRSVLGAQAWTGQVEIAWRLPGDQHDARHQVWITFVPADPARPTGTQLVAGNTDGVSGDGPRPLWWLEPVTVHDRGRVTVMAGLDIDSRPWIGDADAARGHVAAADLRVAAKGWNNRLSLVVPSSERLMEQVLNVGKGSYAGIAATTVADTYDRLDEQAALRIVVNPKTRMNPELARLTLTHEAVHVVTDTSRSQAPLWLVEGLADAVAYDSYPDAARVQQEQARPKLRGTLPQGLPTDGDFDADQRDLDLSYLRAWLAVRQVRVRLGPDGLDRFYAKASAGSRPATLGVDERSVARDVDLNLAQIAAGRTLR